MMRIIPMLLIVLATSASLARADEQCIEAPYMAAATDDQRTLVEIHREILPVLDRFPQLGEALETRAPRLCFSDQMDNAHGYLDVERDEIVLGRSLSRPMQIGILLHELRHLWQFSRGACPSDDLAMNEYARATFALEADASAISLLIAWDMKARGDASVWAALSSWPSHSDIAASFSRAMRDTGDAALATTAAFYQWYASAERHERYYSAACSDYLYRQDKGHLIPRYQLIDVDFFDNLCRLPDGGKYRCSDPDVAPE